MNREGVRNGAIGAVLLVAGLIDPYFVWRFNGSPPSLRSILTGLFALLVTVVLSKLLQRAFKRPAVSSRLWVLAAFAWAVVWALPGSGIYALPLLILPSLLWLRERAWRRVSIGLCLCGALFIATPYVFAAVKAEPVNWLEKPSGTTASGTTVILLFDEFSANATEPLVAQLRKAGEPVWLKTLKPAGQNTINVIPALFSGGNFANDRVCGGSALCTGSTVFNFSSVVVGRPDVDVVGFYMPYCAIASLRYCAAIPFDRKRDWPCTSSRSVSLALERLGKSVTEVCATDLVGDMRRILSATESALWRAPVWSKGGVLYGHLPSPHPVGLSAAQRSLGSDYESNLQDVSRIAAEALDRLRNSGRPFSLILFSDHPLRHSHCDAPVYAVANCDKTRYFDVNVPLIVVGERPSAFEAIESNRDIFSLVN